MSENNGGQAKHEPKKYTFFVDGVKYETDQSELTAAQIKARVPNVEPGDKLSLEGHGDEPDEILQDDQVVSLAKEKGPLRFTIVPSASFGR